MKFDVILYKQQNCERSSISRLARGPRTTKNARNGTARVCSDTDPRLQSLLPSPSLLHQPL